MRLGMSVKSINNFLLNISFLCIIDCKELDIYLCKIGTSFMVLFWNKRPAWRSRIYELILSSLTQKGHNIRSFRGCTDRNKILERLYCHWGEGGECFRLRFIYKINFPRDICMLQDIFENFIRYARCITIFIWILSYFTDIYTTQS